MIIKDAGRLPTILGIFSITVLVGLLEGLNIGLLLPLIENLDPDNEASRHWISRVMERAFDGLGLPFNLGSILLTLAAVIILVASLKYWRMILEARARERIVVWLRTRNMNRLLAADMSFFHRQQVGVLTDTLTTQANHAGTGLYLVTEMLANTGVIISYLVAALLISPTLTAIAISVLFLVSISMQQFISKSKTISIERFGRETELQAGALESLSGMHIIKSFQLEQSRLLDFTNRSENVADTSYKMTRVRSQMLVIQELVLFGVIGLIVYLGVSVLNLAIPIIVALLFTLYRLAPRIGALNGSRQGFVINVAALHSLEELMSETDVSRLESGDAQFVGLSSGIVLDGVSFSYNGLDDVLVDTSFCIDKNKMTAIVGSSGAGKSTIIDLLLRYDDPTKGAILVDGVDLRNLNLSAWRSKIGVVSQDVFLFNDTVANNIALWRPDATEESIIKAAKQAFANDFIQNLPNGYHTSIGDRGWNLSGGQRQRIALARAILNEPEILILDEATSSLDSESETFIQDYINGIRGSSTMVVVAHRMSTIQDADKIVVLQDGRIVEQGNVSSLLDASGPFANYHRLQYGN